MTAPTSDERREVAARLRESRAYISGLPKTSPEQNVFDTFERILACIDYERGNIFDYLADLIDPTCHIVTTAEGMLGCDRCHTLLLGTSAKPNFCPNCGARVSEDGIASVEMTYRVKAIERVCPNCGAHIVPTIERTYDGWIDYCPDCGAELVSE